ncbi:MAG: hypothetical protein ACOC2W_01255 [bacterium]
MAEQNGPKWKRVLGPDLDQQKFEREKKNKNIMSNETFLKACEMLGIEPTKRQASKYNNKKGSAYKYGKNK